LNNYICSDPIFIFFQQSCIKTELFQFVNLLSVLF